MIPPPGRLLRTLVAVAVCLTASCSARGDSESTTVDVAPEPSESAPSTPAPSVPASPAPESSVPAPSDPASAPSSTVAPTTSTVEDAPGACVAELTVRERAALLVWPAVYADDWPTAVAIVEANDVGGVLLMSQRGLDAPTVTARLAELEAASRHGLIVSTDEEGGDVQRLRSVDPLRSQRVVSQDLTPDEAATLIAAHGATVRSVGVDMVLGPVVDVEPNVGVVPLEPSRFFDGSPEVVSAYGAAYLDGWARADLFASIKHFPGHGAASGDTHISPGVTPSLDDLEAFDLQPYRDLLGIVESTDAAVMVGHLTVPGLTDGVPASRSTAAIRYLRDDLGYRDTLLVTDALGMAAVGLPEPEAAVLALAAGIDVVLFTLSSQTPDVIDAIEAAVASGDLDEQHVTTAAAKVMAMLEHDGHTCDTTR